MERKLDKKNVLYLFYAILIFPFTELIVRIISLSVFGTRSGQLPDFISDIFLIVMCLILYYSIDRKDVCSNWIKEVHNKYLFNVLIIITFSIVSVLFVKLKLYEYVDYFFEVNTNTLITNNDVDIIRKYMHSKDKLSLLMKIIYLIFITPIFIEVKYRFVFNGLLRRFIVYIHNEHLIFTSKSKKMLSVVASLIALVFFSLMLNSQHLQGNAIIILAFVGLLTTLAYEMTGTIWTGVTIQVIISLSEVWMYIPTWFKVIVQ
ncbi:MAG: type II CAAX prenyl endopeptidase Rce1 family protein [Bacillota bacterium]